MRPVTADHVMFDEAIAAFRAPSANSLRSNPVASDEGHAILTDFEIESPIDAELYQILPTVCVTLRGAYCALIAPLSIRGQYERQTAHQFAIAVSTIVSFATGRATKAPRDSYHVGQQLNAEAEAVLAMGFPILRAGPGAHELRIATGTLDTFRGTICTVTTLLRDLPYKEYVRVFRAMRFVQLAHQVVRDDFALAYYLLVSAVEIVASRAVPLKEVKEEHPDEHLWSEAAKADTTVKALYRAYREEKGKNKYLRKRFVQFVLNYCPPNTWAELEHPMANLRSYLEEVGVASSWDHLTKRSFFEVYPEDLPEQLVKEVLKNLYTYRSKFTHEGLAPPNRDPTSHNRFFDLQYELDEHTGKAVQLLLPNYSLVAFIAQRSILTFAVGLAKTKGEGDRDV
jgi:hypothetical protein